MMPKSSLPVTLLGEEIGILRGRIFHSAQALLGVRLGQGISKYYTTQVAPTRVETLREIAKSAKSKLVDK